MKKNYVLLFMFLCSCTEKKQIISLPREEKILSPKIQNIPQNLSNKNYSDYNLQNKISPVIIANVINVNHSSLAFLNAGIIEKINVMAGDNVKQGQILASLNNTQEKIELQATIIKLKQKKLAAELEKKKLARIIEQFKAGIVNTATVEKEKNTFDSIMLDVEETKNELTSKGFNLKLTNIIAPYDGFIAKKNKSIGDFVSNGTVVFEIAENKNMEIYAQIPGIYFNKLKDGMYLAIFSSTNRNEIGKIKIRKIIPILDTNSRSFELYATVTSLYSKLNPGDFVEIKL